MAKKKRAKKSAHAGHASKEHAAPKAKSAPAIPAQYNTTNDTILKAVFIVLGVGLLIAAYYIGFLVGGGSGGGYTTAEVQEAMQDEGVAAGTITSVVDNLQSKTKPVPTGNAPDGAVVITEYSDFECPYCGRFYSDAYKKIKDAYGDKVTFEYKHFPLGFHANAQKAAEAAECARDQDKFWEYHNTLFETKKLDVTSLKQHAADLGLDTATFNSCLDSGEKASVIEAHKTEAGQRGVRGTPSFWINGELVVGAQPFENFKQKIDAALAGEAPAPAPAPTQPQEPAAPTKVEGDISDDDAVKGDPDAPVTIVEFSDYECPFCGRHTSQTAPLIDKNFVDTGKVKIVFRDFPLSMHPHAQKAAEAAECAGEQGKYWDMHDKLYANQQSLSVDNYKKWAGEIGLDQDAFDTCLDSGAMADEVKQDFADGQKYGVRGTPASFVNGVLVSGAQPYQVFEAAIEAALEE